MTRITELEKEMLIAINFDYTALGIENTDFHNTFGSNAEKNKELRGAFSSLKKKKIVDHYDEEGCFNPIYPTRKFIEVIEQIGEEPAKNAVEWVRRDELWAEHSEEWRNWLVANNMTEPWQDPDTKIYYMNGYPFDRWLKETKNIEF